MTYAFSGAFSVYRDSVAVKAMKRRNIIIIVCAVVLASISVDTFRSTRLAERILINRIVRDLHDSSKVLTIEKAKKSFVGGFYGRIGIECATDKDMRELIAYGIVPPDAAERITTIVLIFLKKKRFLCPHMYGSINIYYDASEKYVCHMIDLHREDVM